MKQILVFIIAIIVSACGGDGNQTTATNAATAIEPTVATDAATASAPAAKAGASIVVDGRELSLGASLMVQKDRDKLKPGNDYLCVLTASGGPNKEALTLNFLLDLKPGDYPVVGMGFQRGPSDNGEVYGGLMGGAPRITRYKVNITECKDLGSNGQGGKRWSISGTFEDIEIKALPLMLVDESRKHPQAIGVKNGRFYNLTFDDNWDEIMKKGMDEMKK